MSSFTCSFDYDAPASNKNVGKAVACLYLGGNPPYYVSGTVTQVNKDGTFTVTWDDTQYGSKQEHCKVSMLKRPIAEHAPFDWMAPAGCQSNVGAAVMCRYDANPSSCNTFYAAVITGADADGTFTVKWDVDGEVRQHIPRTLIQHPLGQELVDKYQDAAEVARILAECNNDPAVVNFQGWNGWSAMHHAVHGHMATVKLLLNANYHLQQKDDGGNTAMETARNYGHHDVYAVMSAAFGRKKLKRFLGVEDPCTYVPTTDQERLDVIWCVEKSIKSAKSAAMLEYAPQCVRGDPAMMLRLIKLNAENGWLGQLVSFADSSLFDNAAFMRSAVKTEPMIFAFGSVGVRADHDIAKETFSSLGNMLCYASPELRADRAIVLLAARHSKWYAPLPELPPAPETDGIRVEVGATVQARWGTSSTASFYAAEVRRVNEDGTFTVQFTSGGQIEENCTRNSLAREWASVLKAASPEVKEIHEVLVAAVSSYGPELEHVPAHLVDKQLTMTALSQSGSLRMLPADSALRNDKELVLAAMRIVEYAELREASPALRGDRDFILACIDINGMALEHASKDLCDDHDIVLAATAKDGLAAQHASKRQQEDAEIAARYSVAYEATIDYD